MRKIIFFLLTIFLAVAAFTKVPDSFLTDWDKVKQTAKTADKLIYLHFTTDWCSWCRRIEADTYTDAKVLKSLNDFAAASLDCTNGSKTVTPEQSKTNKSLHSKFGGDGYPFLVILSADGETVFNTINGYVAPDRFLSEVEKAKKIKQEYTDFLEYSKTADKKSFEYAIKAMTIAQKVKKSEMAVNMAKQVLDIDPANAKGQGAAASWIILQNMPVNSWEKDGGKYFDNIKKYDPKNEKGILEEAYWEYAYTNYINRNNVKCIELLSELVKTGKTQNGFDIYGLLGYAQAANGDNKGAIASLEKALTINSNGRMAESIKAKLKMLKEK